MSSHIVVTGAAGYIGSALVPLLRTQGYEVWTPSSLAQIAVGSSGPSSVVHLAANTQGDWETNVLGTAQVANQVPEGCRLVFASSLTAAAPQDWYDSEKRAAESLLALCQDISCVILRLGRVYGDPIKLNRRSTLNRMIVQAARGEGLAVYGAAYAARDYVYLDDVLRAFVRALDEDVAAGIYDVGTGKGISLLEAAQTLARLAGVPWYIDDGATDSTPSVAASSRWLPGWEPKTSLRDGLARVLAWAHTHLRQEQRELVTV